MAWQRPGNESSTEPMMTLITDAYKHHQHSVNVLIFTFLQKHNVVFSQLTNVKLITNELFIFFKPHSGNSSTKVFTFAYPFCKFCDSNNGYIDGLVQDCSISIFNALEILQSCTKPSIWYCLPNIISRGVVFMTLTRLWRSDSLPTASILCPWVRGSRLCHLVLSRACL